MLLKTIRSNSGDIWDVRKFLADIKLTNPGFNFCIKLNNQSKRLEGFFWMFPEMKEDLLCFSNILFLDACKRDVNKPVRPYQSVVLMNNEMEIIPVIEGLTIAERLDVYLFIIKACQDMEPRFNIKSIKIIFTDQLISDNLLDMLNIRDTCVLHGDIYHLIHKVFPDSFKGVWELISDHVSKMLDTNSKTEWEHLYNLAAEKIMRNPEMVLTLEEIYKNHKYYSRWYLLQMEGNLF